MKKICLFGAVVLSLILAGSSWGAIINVPDDKDLQDGLNTAANNAEDYTINIAAGTYDASTSTFSYTPVANNSLTIVGAGAGSTILDGGKEKQVMNIDYHGSGWRR